MLDTAFERNADAAGKYTGWGCNSVGSKEALMKIFLVNLVAPRQAFNSGRT
jgi:hypothetical protein